MDRAIGASGLLRAIPAALKTDCCVFEQRFTFLTELRCRSMLPLAIAEDHRSNRSPFTVQPAALKVYVFSPLIPVVVWGLHL
jgi:hypothetical protein